MENSNMVSKIIPEEWHPIDDYSSHRPMLYLGMKSVIGNIVELGCGYGSTPLLFKMWEQDDKLNYWAFASLETNPEYAGLFGQTDEVGSYDRADFYMPCGLLFIDCAPGEIRKDLIKKYANEAQIIIVHDTEPGADYVYHMSEILNSFTYRCDLKISGMPQTTAVSNVNDFGKWKGLYNDKFEFV